MKPWLSDVAVIRVVRIHINTVKVIRYVNTSELQRIVVPVGKTPPIRCGGNVDGMALSTVVIIIITAPEFGLRRSRQYAAGDQ